MGMVKFSLEFTQEDLARLAGLHRTVVNLIENGNWGSIRLDTIVKLARVSAYNRRNCCRT